MLNFITRTVVVATLLILTLATTIQPNLRVLLDVDPVSIKIAANVVKYTATANQATIYQPNDCPEDSRLVNGRINSFIMDKEGFDKWRAEYYRKYGGNDGVCGFELSCTQQLRITTSAWYNCDVVKEYKRHVN